MAVKTVHGVENGARGTIGEKTRMGGDAGFGIAIAIGVALSGSGIDCDSDIDGD